jgi:DNA-binding response OmpR family regulator
VLRVNNSTHTTNEPSESYEAPRQALRVVVVEDQKDSLLTLVALLRAEGHEARGVGSAKEFWNMYFDFAPEVCLVDIGLPDRSGYDIAQDMVRRFGETRPKLIAVTAWTKASDRILARIAGFDSHVGKPYDPNALLALVANLARGSAS